MKKLLILLVLFSAGCSAETVDSEKLDESYSGKIFKKYENGQKKEEENYKNGKMDGLYIGWFENGQKKFEINFKDDKQDGPAIFWYEDGQKKEEENFKDGEWDKKTLIRWDENGQKTTEIKDGKKIVGWNVDLQGQ
ncbi:MAG: hypothetical protein P8M80_07965 [Pirellulaceae bacterium]|nr:hypothetical protein [Pirellulaceae bacterium]